MAVIQAAPSVHLTWENNGDTLIVGSPSSVEEGVCVVQFVDDVQVGKEPFAGGLQVLGMVRVQDALRLGTPLVPNVLLVPVPYRRINIGGIQSDYALVTDGTPIISSSIISVPASGLWIALLVTCSGGGGTVYSTNVVGSA